MLGFYGLRRFLWLLHLLTFFDIPLLSGQKFQPVAFPFNNLHSGLGFHVIKSLPFSQTKNKSPIPEDSSLGGL